MFYELRKMIPNSDILNNNEYIYKSLIFTTESTDIDYYVIIGYNYTDKYLPSNTIVFQMEPWVYDETKQWGVKTWGAWSDPVANLFLHVNSHKRFLNPAQWFFNTHNSLNMNLLNNIRKDKVIAIISSKYNDTGHINRVDFVKYVESLGYDIIDVYGKQNYHNFRNYKGMVEDIDKGNLIQSYKYILSVENNNEKNYATEKIWEAFITGTLCFYDGCPNMTDYVSDSSYIPLELNKKHESLEIMLFSIQHNIWNNKKNNILNTRKEVLLKYNIFEIIYNVIYKSKND